MQSMKYSAAIFGIGLAAFMSSPATAAMCPGNVLEGTLSTVKSATSIVDAPEFNVQVVNGGRASIMEGDRLIAYGIGSLLCLTNGVSVHLRDVSGIISYSCFGGLVGNGYSGICRLTPSGHQTIDQDFYTINGTFIYVFR
jgi:hypothetical protein